MELDLLSSNSNNTFGFLSRCPAALADKKLRWKRARPGAASYNCTRGISGQWFGGLRTKFYLDGLSIFELDLASGAVSIAGGDVRELLM